MEKLLYDGSVHDRTNRTSDAFLAVNSCGVHVNRTHRTLREAGRVDWHLLYVESGELMAVLEGKQLCIGEGGFVIYAPHQRQEYWLNGGVCYWLHFAGKNTDVP